MIKIENVDIHGFETAIRGMRNPMNSWDKSDSGWVDSDLENKQECVEIDYDNLIVWAIGNNDLNLMKKLVSAGSDHRKFMRFITVTCDIIAPDYFFKEFSTYRIGVTESSTSTMHKIHSKEFTLDDFSHEHLMESQAIDDDDVYFYEGEGYCGAISSDDLFFVLIQTLNHYRKMFLKTNDKKYWWKMIQLLPMSYNYRRTVILNYEVLRNMYHARKSHKLDEWRDFCKWIESLPYSELITE